MGSRGGVRGPTPPAVDPSTMGPMPRATTQRHPPDQLIHAIRAALLSTIRAECPEVLLIHSRIYVTPCSTRSSIRRRLGRPSWPSSSAARHTPVDMHRGSPHRQVRAQIVRWARRWHLNAPGIRDEAWRTLSWWVRWARDSRPVGHGLLSTIWAEWPEVLDDLRDAVFTPLIHSAMPQEDIVALLKRRAPHPVDIHRGSLHRQVRAQIVRWARRWYLNAPGIRDEAWRTLSWWARWARDSRPAGRAFGWAPLVDVDTTARHLAPPTPKLLRPRDGVALIWLVRHRVWPTPASLEDLANDATERGYVTSQAVRVAVNRLARMLDLPVRRRGRPRAARSPAQVAMLGQSGCRRRVRISTPMPSGSSGRSKKSASIASSRSARGICASSSTSTSSMTIVRETTRDSTTSSCNDRHLRYARTPTCTGVSASADCSVSTLERPHEWSAH